MSSFVLWIDSAHAKLFSFSSSGVEGRETKALADHGHTSPQEEDRFFHGLADQLKTADEVLICGPGLAKSHFKSFLEKHHASSIAKKVKGVEPTDHPTDAQIKSLARKFFTKSHLYS